MLFEADPMEERFECNISILLGRGEGEDDSWEILFGFGMLAVARTSSSFSTLTPGLQFQSEASAGEVGQHVTVAAGAFGASSLSSCLIQSTGVVLESSSCCPVPKLGLEG